MMYSIGECLIPESFRTLKREISEDSKAICRMVTSLRPYDAVSSGFVLGHADILAYYCQKCGAELYGKFEQTGGCSDVSRFSSLEFTNPQINSANERLRAKANKFLPAVEQFDKNSSDAYKRACEIEKCPICGAPLSKHAGYFVDLGLRGSTFDLRGKYIKENVDEYQVDFSKIFADMAAERKEEDMFAEDAGKFVNACSLSISTPTPVPADVVKNNVETLKEYILNLIHLENNIYALTQRLATLYYQRTLNAREIIFFDRFPVLEIDQTTASLNETYEVMLAEVIKAQRLQPNPYVRYPTAPKTPLYETPGLFNKKKVLAENEALRVKYEAELAAYQKEVQECDERKKRLIDEERAAAIKKAQERCDAAKADLDRYAEASRCKLEQVKTQPNPVKAIKKLLDQEIKETETLLKAALSARAELYSCGVIFEKYRNAVALSSFYEYLMAGRCSALEGVGGAYNLYESEIRADCIISKLDEVIASLEEIKKNQYMMYKEMQEINESLRSLNFTMGQALAAIRGIKANTSQMSEYMKNISDNSAVIAHNTAVSAYYSKINAQLTNSLGYMVALR